MVELKAETSEVIIATRNTNVSIKKLLKYTSVSIGCLCIFIFIGFWTLVHEEKLTNVEVLEKFTEKKVNTEYFIKIDGVKLSTNSNAWELVEVGEVYNVEYKWSHSQSAEMEHIEKAD
ncbi:hypothetical protein [Aquibacillus saliphilus]|uniref:hypothetical protein n=1 Tax=Aquibacillus saliphilus TaxID=1909422 RepID=UPI001CF062DB|nr:hypothetical protein [Aquibacillus saliphilus]